MFEPAVAVTDDVLTDYLFGQLDLDGQIQVEHALSKDPALAATIAGRRAKMLAIKRLAESVFDHNVPARLADLLKPLLGEEGAVQPERMATWLMDGRTLGLMGAGGGHGGNGTFMKDADLSWAGDRSPEENC